MNEIHAGIQKEIEERYTVVKGMNEYMPRTRDRCEDLNATREHTTDVAHDYIGRQRESMYAESEDSLNCYDEVNLDVITPRHTGADHVEPGRSFKTYIHQDSSLDPSYDRLMFTPTRKCKRNDAYEHCEKSSCVYSTTDGDVDTGVRLDVTNYSHTTINHPVRYKPVLYDTVQPEVHETHARNKMYDHTIPYTKRSDSNSDSVDNNTSYDHIGLK